ncbi:MAG: hypothetical protein ACTS2F_29685 [Thainema sp.]
MSSLKVFLVQLVTSPSQAIVLGISCTAILVASTLINTGTLQSNDSDRNRFPGRRQDGGTQLIKPPSEIA